LPQRLAAKGSRREMHKRGDPEAGRVAQMGTLLRVTQHNVKKKALVTEVLAVSRTMKKQAQAGKGRALSG
jgi:hypothetical protein